MKERLIEALRSGEYVQAQGKLRDTDGFCCLGVACDLYHKYTGKGSWKRQDNDNEALFPYVFITDEAPEFGSVSVMPSEVQEYFGFKHNNPAYSNRSLAGLNDGGLTFAEIADLIEMEDDLTLDEFGEVKAIIGDGLSEGL